MRRGVLFGKGITGAFTCWLARAKMCYLARAKTCYMTIHPCPCRVQSIVFVSITLDIYKPRISCPALVESEADQLALQLGGHRSSLRH